MNIGHNQTSKLQITPAPKGQHDPPYLVTVESIEFWKQGSGILIQVLKVKK